MTYPGSIHFSPSEEKCKRSAVSELHRVQLVLCPDTRVLSVGVFLSVFEEANRFVRDTAAYEVTPVCLGVHPRIHCCNVMGPEAAAVRAGADTLIVLGPEEAGHECLNATQLDWLRNACAASGRVVASGGGTYYLAAAGLLNDRKVVVHWKMQEHFGQRFPKVQREPDKLYAEDGNLSTSAGSVADFDFALKLVENDFGAQVASEVAQTLLLHYRRPGETAQVSNVLRAQASAVDAFSKLLAWIPDNLTDDLSVRALARRTAMSPRNFARVFRDRVGATPARYIEGLRFEAAQRELRNLGRSVVQAAESSGFRNVETLRRIFLRRLGVTPGRYRKDRNVKERTPIADGSREEAKPMQAQALAMSPQLPQGMIDQAREARTFPFLLGTAR